MYRAADAVVVKSKMTATSFMLAQTSVKREDLYAQEYADRQKSLKVLVLCVRRSTLVQGGPHLAPPKHGQSPGSWPKTTLVRAMGYPGSTCDGSSHKLRYSMSL